LGEGTPSVSTPCRFATSPYSWGMPEPVSASLRQNPGGSTASMSPTSR